MCQYESSPGGGMNESVLNYIHLQTIERGEQWKITMGVNNDDYSDVFG